jgi:nucleoside-diphosphate-sugar epimerase
LRDLVYQLARLIDSKSLLNFGALPYRAGQVMYAVADPVSFFNVTGWRPLVSLDEGLRGMIQKLNPHV